MNRAVECGEWPRTENGNSPVLDDLTWEDLALRDPLSHIGNTVLA